MSVAATSSPSLDNKHLKRPYEAPDAAATLATTTAGGGASKRGRAGEQEAGAAHAHAHQQHYPSHDPAYVLGASALTALRGLFPEMSEQVRREREEKRGAAVFKRMAVWRPSPRPLSRASGRALTPPRHALSS